ncbi:MAG: helix-turn-helix domain-containing protein [Candidatus Bathyarchaeia archaeon]
MELNKEDEMNENRRIQLQNVKTLEQLQVLRQDREEIAIICRVELEESVSNIEDYIKLINDNAFEVKIIEREKTGAYIVFVKVRLPSSPRVNPIGAEEAYFVSREIREGKVKVTFLGTTSQIKKVLEELQRLGRRYKIVSLTDAKFSLDSPLNVLTEKQRKVLLTAYKMGYYNLPRKISSEQLAKKLNIHKTALVTHRRKAELRILTQMLKE